MANILLVTADKTHAAYTRTATAFTGAGHTVTGVTDDQPSLDAVSLAGIDLIATVRINGGASISTPSYVEQWLSAKWATGKPILVGGVGAQYQTGTTSDTAVILGLISLVGTHLNAGAATAVTVTSGHPTVAGYSGNVNVYTTLDQIAYGFSGTAAAGTTTANLYTNRPVMAAVDAGQAIYGGAAAPGTTAPARAGLCSWMYAGAYDYTADGKTLLNNLVAWLAPSGPVTPQAKVATGAKVALGFAASPVVSGTTRTPATVRLAFAAEAHAPTSVATPARVGLTFAATSPQAAHTLRTGAAVALTFTATGGDHATPPWTGDTLGRDTLWMDQVARATLTVLPPLATPPPHVVERPIGRLSFTGMPATARNADSYQAAAPYGTPHLFVGGRDVTYLRDTPAQLGSFTDELPGGEQTFDFQLPQIQPQDVPGTGDLAAFTPDANVDVEIVRPDGTRDHQWSGRLILDAPGHDDTTTHSQWQAVGTLVGDADHQRHRAPIIQDPEDIGTVIPRVLNAVVSHRYPAIPNASTGIQTGDRGSWGDSVWEHVQAVLGLAWTPDQRQWTIAPKPGTPRVYSMVLKQDPNAPTWTFTLNQPGLTVDLPKDETQRANAIFGHGVDSTGAAWANWFFPDISTDDAPPYPFTSASKVIAVGTTDAMTDTGNGVSVWQQGARNLGYNIAVDGVYNTSDEDVVRRVQAQCGIQVDGRIGPQTWVATFQTGSNAGDLNNALRLPLAYDARVEPHTYAANGAVTGSSSAYDPAIARYELDVDFGTGITKADGIRSARQMLARMRDPGRTGTITATSDPWEGHKLDIRPGHRIVVKGARGGDLTTWVVSRTADLAQGTVTFAVDTKARDAMTLAAIQSRNIAAGLTPDGRPLPIHRKSHQTTDVVTQFDVESRAGVIPRLPLFNHLWTVVNVPVTLTGTISIVDLVTDTPRSEFVVAIFGAPITPAHLLQYVGNPFSDSGSQNWTKNNDLLLDRFAWAEKYGDASQPCGYSPGNKADGAPLSGRLLDNNPLSFTSTRGGRAWLAFYATADTWIHGRIRSGPIPV